MSQDQATDSTPGGRTLWGCTLVALQVLTTALVILAFEVAYLVGMMSNALTVLMMVMTPISLVSRLWDASRGRLELGLLRHPLRRQSRPYLLQGLNRCLSWAMTAIPLTLSLVPIQFEPGEYRAIRIVTAVLVG